jgi:signal transduction histidine kinase
MESMLGLHLPAKSTPRRRLIWVGVVALVEGAAAFALYLGAGASSVRATVFVAIGWTYSVVAGLMLWRRPANPLWRLMGLAGGLWFAQVLALSTVSALAWLGLGVRSGYLVVVFHIALAMPSGALSNAGRRVVVAAYWAAVGVAVIDVATGYACGARTAVCRDAVDLSDLTGVSLVAAVAGRLLVVAVVAWGTVVLVNRLRKADVPTRRAAGGIFVALTVHGVAVVAVDVGVGPDGAVGSWVLLITAWLLPIAVAAGVVVVEIHRAQISGLVLAMDRGLSPAELRDELARCLGDETLRVGYPTEAGLVDHRGSPFTSGSEGRMTTTVDSDGVVIAVLDHVAALQGEPELLAATVAASRFALEHARLTAVVRAQLVELEASRRRLVEAGDNERRRIERDLHDGAQQRLLSVALELGRIRHRARQQRNQDLAAALEVISDDLERAVDELRRLARGVYPMVLTDRGLPAALDALALRSPVALRLDVDLPRLPSAVETTVYFVVAEALTNSIRHATAATVWIGAHLDDHGLEVTVCDDGVGGARLEPGGGLAGLVDRAAALGGTLHLDSTSGRGTSVSVFLPVDVLT